MVKVFIIGITLLLAYQIVVTSNRKRPNEKTRGQGGFFKALGGLVVLFVSLLPDEDEDEDDHFIEKQLGEGNPYLGEVPPINFVDGYRSYDTPDTPTPWQKIY